MRSEHSKSMNVDYTEPVTNTTTTAANATDYRENKCILLQTAQAIALNELNKKFAHIRVLFDSGSQRMYITKCLRDKLNLKPIGQKQLHLNTFGIETSVHVVVMSFTFAYKNIDPIT